MISAGTLTKYLCFLSEESKSIVRAITDSSAALPEFLSQLTDLICEEKHADDIVVLAMRLAFFMTESDTVLRISSVYEELEVLHVWVMTGLHMLGQMSETEVIIESIDNVLSSTPSLDIQAELLVFKANTIGGEKSFKIFDEVFHLIDSNPILESLRGFALAVRSGRFFELDDYENCVKDAEEALKLITPIGDIYMEALVLITLSNGISDQHRSIEILKQALALYHELDVHSMDDTLYNNLGFSSVAIGDYDSAINYYRMAIEATESFGSITYHAIMNLSTLYGNLGRFEESLESATRALEISRKVSPSASAPHLEMARALILSKKYDEAFDYLELGNQLAMRSESISDQGRYYLVRGILDRELGNNRASLLALNKSLELAESIGNLYHVLQILFNLAETEIVIYIENPSNEHILSSGVAFSRIEQIAIEQDMPGLLVQVRILKSELENLRGNQDGAMKYLESANSIAHEYKLNALHERIQTLKSSLANNESRPSILSRFQSYIRKVAIPTVQPKILQFEIFGCIIIQKFSGIEVYSKYIDTRLASNSSIVAGLIAAVSNFTQGLRDNTSGDLQSIVHQEIAVLLEHGEHVTCALLVDRDVYDARVLERRFLREFESTYGTTLQSFKDGFVKPIDATKMFEDIVVRRTA